MDGAQFRNPTIFIEDMVVGLEKTRSREVSEADIAAFGDATGDMNPVHFDEDYAQGTPFNGRIAHGMLTAGHISAVIGEDLPGPGAIYMKQSMTFLAPVRPGDIVVTSCRVVDIRHEKRRVTLACECRVGNVAVLKGEAVVMVPSRP